MMRDALLETSHIVARQLCDLGSEVSRPAHPDAPSLVFPRKRGEGADAPGEVRVSEAEARILFCLELARRSIPFAIEAPTLRRYSFSGKRPMSARTDLLTYAVTRASQSPLTRECGIEFKAHNAPPAAFRKDLEKLIREGHDGLWFHLLQNIDSRTLPSILEKLQAAFRALHAEWASHRGELTFSFAVIAKRCWIHRTIRPGDDPAGALSLSYGVRAGRMVIDNPNGWAIESV